MKNKEQKIDQIVLETLSFEHLFSVALESGQPFAAWKMPFENTQSIVVSLQKEALKVSADLEELPNGFLAHPFQAKDKQAYLIPADIYYTTEMDHIDFSNSYDLSIKERVEHEIHSFDPDQPLKRWKGNMLKEHFPPTSKEHFTSIVAESVEAMQNEEFTKVVLSRTKEAKLKEDFSPFEFFQKLSESYPAAFVSICYIPNVGLWLGASPETLISVDEHGIFKTVALAGTQASNGISPKEASWKSKEIEEQALVSRYIINCFKKIRLREFEEIGPRTVAAAHLLHLCTEFKVDTKTTNFPQLGTVMLDLLHPTSAVCGMPKEIATDFILRNEQYNRSIYSGYIGPIGLENRHHLFVNLRCLQLFNDHALLYAGAGITADSDPEKEWNETEIKMDTMLKHLNS
ncbi:isochorismate synthase [Flammeovirga yaeyamensis]|uniref:isochorismate synthase n=1 Tax=Flammeovirga yaeyamensis TaxID=367791 RepID=A0AAX1N5U0_9BACT|nr:chorismate-binding protein [Flammeovirga yaeyamensis]MBB3697418.1 isochorismate synthase [Flammeovirga yaeyamensis]NMF36112.1 chorismate-binding protein [Flammeovirga yaeyamensis]QWG02845.1 isochorismate synthase [Flammeovirga yaeyamensis]